LEPEARAILVLLSKTRGIEAYSCTQRLFTEQQRLAMIARDGGCSYWGCDMPAAWTQAHHVHDYRHTRHTRVDDGALVCGGDHRSFEGMGWTNQMIHGRPHWVPPSWIDPDRTPRRNRLHD
ncbi:MAG: HNH endonuclease signature motif containing protein, partial [Jatrophihabitantaceae bacterium]